MVQIEAAFKSDIPLASSSMASIPSTLKQRATSLTESQGGLRGKALILVPGIRFSIRISGTWHILMIGKSFVRTSNSLARKD